MKNIFFFLCTSSFLIFSANHVCGANATQIKNALDNPEGITFQTAANWSAKTGAVSAKNIGKVPSKNNNYLECKSPGKADPPKFYPFSFTVKGAGTLSFNYQVSLDWYNDSELRVYIGNDPDYGDIWSDSGWWATDDYDISDWWQEEEIYISSETYTQQVSFAVFGPDGDKDFYEKPELDKEWGEVLVNNAWLDNFVWIPDEDATILELDPDPEEDNSFDESLTISLWSDYDNLTFRYTLDGTDPDTKSTMYNPEEGIEISENTVIKVIAFEGNTRINNEVYSAEYIRMTKAPKMQLSQKVFEDAFLSFGSEDAAAEYFYAFNENLPERLKNGNAGENTFKETEFNLSQHMSEDSITVNVLAKAANFAESLIIYENFEKATLPKVFCTADSRLSEWEKKDFHPYFGNNAKLELQLASGQSAHYQIDDGDVVQYKASEGINVTESCKVKIQIKDADPMKLRSNILEIELFKTMEEITLPAGSLTEGWNLFLLAAELGTKANDYIIEQWQPIAYDIDKKTYYRPKLLNAGQSYWIFNSQENPKPEITFKAFPIDKFELPLNKWILSGNVTDQELSGFKINIWEAQKFLQVDKLTAGKPAWLYKEE